MKMRLPLRFAALLLGGGALLALTIAPTVAHLLRSPAPRWQLLNVTGHLPDLQFTLTNDAGEPVTEAQARGHVALLYFGFTGCSSQCPLTMNRLSSLLRRLGPDAQHIRVLFVTIDPEHDTPPMLHRYLTAFDAQHMEGLTGNSQAIEALAKRYRAAYNDAENSAGDDKPHSSLVYIFDASGHARLLAMPEDSDEEILSDLERLAHG